MDINAGAPVTSFAETLIAAPIETVWAIQTDVAAWPSWREEVDAAEAGGPLQAGSVFRRRLGDLDVTSTVAEIDPPRRLVWTGAAQGIVAVQVWTFAARDGGVLVHTAESWEGEPVSAQPEMMQAALDRSLRSWLEQLKRAAER